MSHTSRSYQLAPLNKPVIEGTALISSAYVLTLILDWCATESMLYTT